MQVWHIASRTIKFLFSGHEGDISSLDVARNGRYFASGSSDKTVRVWDLVDGKEELLLSAEDVVTTIAISPDNRYVAAGSEDKIVRIWDVTKGYLVTQAGDIDGHRGGICSVAFAPNGRDVVSGSLDKTLKMWEFTTVAPLWRPLWRVPRTHGKCVRSFAGHKVSAHIKPQGPAEITERIY